MKILFDNGTPKPIARSHPGHEITYARQIGWHEMKNGEMIERAEEFGYELLLSQSVDDRIPRIRANLIGTQSSIRGGDSQ